MTRKNTPEVFWQKVNKECGGCWNWDGRKNKQGYGSLKISGKETRAHRYSYFLIHGNIPDGFDILHKCDNPSCVNPDHLFIGKDIDNVRDAISKGRHINPKTVCKLTVAQVIEIKSKYIPIVYSIRKLSKEYNVSYWAIQSILHGVNWKNVRTQ